MQLLGDLANDTSLLEPLAIRIMPRDVVTRWNSTYDMLVFALKYRKAIDEISGDREMRKYELEEEEWDLVQQLCDLLEVRGAHLLISVTHHFPVIQGRDPFLFALDTQPCHRDSRNGSHRHPSCHSKPQLEVLTCHSCIACARKSPSEQVL